MIEPLTDHSEISASLHFPNTCHVKKLQVPRQSKPSSPPGVLLKARSKNKAIIASVLRTSKDHKFSQRYFFKPKAIFKAVN